jgi:hypothetical protein
MSFPALSMPGMPGVLVGFIHHLDALGRERRTQLFRDDIARCHGGAHSARDGRRSTVSAGKNRANVLVKT